MKKKTFQIECERTRLTRKRMKILQKAGRKQKRFEKVKAVMVVPHTKNKLARRYKNNE